MTTNIKKNRHVKTTHRACCSLAMPRYASLCLALSACGGGGGSNKSSPELSGSGQDQNSRPDQVGNEGGAPDSPLEPVFTYDETARFRSISQIETDRLGNVYVVDAGDDPILLRKIANNGEVSTLSANLPIYYQYKPTSQHGLYIVDWQSAHRLIENGVLTKIIDFPWPIWAHKKITIDSQDNLYILVSDGNTDAAEIYRLSPDGILTRVIGPIQSASHTRTFALDAHGNIYLYVDNDVYGKGKVIKITGTTITEVPVDIPGNQVLHMEADSKNNLYVYSYTSSPFNGCIKMSLPCPPVTTAVYFTQHSMTDGSVINLVPPRENIFNPDVPYPRITSPGSEGFSIDGEDNLYALHISNGARVYKKPLGREWVAIAGHPTETGTAD